MGSLELCERDSTGTMILCGIQNGTLEIVFIMLFN